MVKNYIQNIPSQLYSSYTNQICLPYKGGFLYYVNGYDYTKTRAIKVKPLIPLGPANRGYPDTIFDVRARNRFAFYFNAYSWNRTNQIIGTVSPMTGQRSKNWWIDNNLYASTRVFNYYCYKTLQYTTSMYLPAWYQTPVIYLADKINNKIYRINPNLETVLSEIGSSGSGNSQFLDIRSFYDDEQSIYVCDTGNSRIQIFDKVSLSWLNTITTFDTDDKPIITPTAICTDDEYIYFFDLGYSGVKRIRKDDYKNCTTINIKTYAGESTPQIISFENTFEYIYYLTSNNNRLTLFSKLNNTILSEFKNNDNFSQVINDDEHTYLVDTVQKKIIVLGHSYLQQFFDIGPGCFYDIDFQSVSQICISGDLLFVYDNVARKIWRIDLTNITVLDQWDISALFGTDILLLNEPQQFFRIWH